MFTQKLNFYLVLASVCLKKKEEEREDMQILPAYKPTHTHVFHAPTRKPEGFTLISRMLITKLNISLIFPLHSHEKLLS